MKRRKFQGASDEYGNLAETRVYEFLRQRGIASHGSGSVLKPMRVAHREEI